MPQTAASHQTHAFMQSQAAGKARKRPRPVEHPVADATVPSAASTQELAGRIVASDNRPASSRQLTTIPSQVAATSGAVQSAGTADAATAAMVAGTGVGDAKGLLGADREARSRPSDAGQMPARRAGRLQQAQGPAFIRVEESQPVRNVHAGPLTASPQLPQAIATFPVGRQAAQPSSHKPPAIAESQRSQNLYGMPVTSHAHRHSQTMPTGVRSHLLPQVDTAISDVRTPQCVQAVTADDHSEHRQARQPTTTTTRLSNPASTPTQIRDLLSVPPQASAILDNKSPHRTGSGLAQTPPAALQDTHSLPALSTRTNQTPAAVNMGIRSAANAQISDTGHTPAATLDCAPTEADTPGIGARTASLEETPDATAGNVMTSSAQQQSVSRDAPLLLQSLGRRKAKKQRLSNTPDSRSDNAWQDLLNMEQGWHLPC